MTSSKLFTYQELTRFTDGIRSRLSGSKAISFMIFANLTGSSLRRKIYDVFSHAFKPEKKIMTLELADNDQRLVERQIM